MTDYNDYYSYEAIMARKLANVPNNLDKRQGSLIYTAIAPSAKEQETAYGIMEANQKNAYPFTADREYLIRHASLRGIKVLPATKALVEADFWQNYDRTLRNNNIILGMRFSLANSTLNFTVTEKLVTQKWVLECETPGTVGNLTSGNLVAISVVPDLALAEINGIHAYGSDEESTEHLRQRYADSINSQAFGGNIASYKEFAKSIPGVTQVKVLRAYDPSTIDVPTPGHVGLVILAENGQPATQVLIDTVQNEIDPAPGGTGLGLAPIDHIVHTLTCAITKIYVKLTIIYGIGSSWDTIGSQITKAIDDYIISVRNAWENTAPELYYVRISQIMNAALDVPGVVDITSCTISTDGVTYSASNLLLNPLSVPKKEVVIAN